MRLYNIIVKTKVSYSELAGDLIVSYANDNEFLSTLHLVADTKTKKFISLTFNYINNRSLIDDNTIMSIGNVHDEMLILKLAHNQNGYSGEVYDDDMKGTLNTIGNLISTLTLNAKRHFDHQGDNDEAISFSCAFIVFARSVFCDEANQKIAKIIFSG